MKTIFFFLSSPSLSLSLMETGWPSWRLTLCLLGAWVVVFLVIARGIKSSGKASYFLALFPYVIIFALLIRAVTLEGASKGILYFLTPQWHELLNPKVCDTIALTGTQQNREHTKEEERETERRENKLFYDFL